MFGLYLFWMKNENIIKKKFREMMGDTKFYQKIYLDKFQHDRNIHFQHITIKFGKVLQKQKKINNKLNMQIDNEKNSLSSNILQKNFKINKQKKIIIKINTLTLWNK